MYRWLQGNLGSQTLTWTNWWPCAKTSSASQPGGWARSTRWSFLGWVDGELGSGPEPRRQVASWIRTLRPDVVLGHDPWRRWRLHPDHRHAGWLTVDGIVAARDPHFFPELGLAPHRPDALLLFEADEPDHAEDTAGFEATKTSAIEAFVSQYETTLDLPPHPSDADLARLRGWVVDKLAEAGADAGLASAELFKLIDDL